MINIEAISNMAVEQKIKELEAELEAISNKEVVKVTTNGTKKNQKPGKVTPGRKYVLLEQSLKTWGKVPQQQLDLAAILSNNLKAGTEYTEHEVFELLQREGANYSSIATSVQDPTYLFKYYRGLKNDGKHAGFIARDFVKQIG